MPYVLVASCDAVRECKQPIAYVDRRGFVYCEYHGTQRLTGEPGCRKLRSGEVKAIINGQTIARY